MKEVAFPLNARVALSAKGNLILIVTQAGGMHRTIELPDGQALTPKYLASLIMTSPEVKMTRNMAEVSQALAALSDSRVEVRRIPMGVSGLPEEEKPRKPPATRREWYDHFEPKKPRPQKKRLEPDMSLSDLMKELDL